MVFNDDKKYYRERKTPAPIKNKLKKDINKMKIDDFSYEDIAKQTTFSKKQRTGSENGRANSRKSDSNQSSYANTFDNRGESPSNSSSVYGTDDADPFAPAKTLKHSLQNEIKRTKTHSSTSSNKTIPSKTVTMEQFVTDRILKNRVEKKDAEKSEKKKETRTSSRFRRQRSTRPANPQVRREPSKDNTIDQVLKGIPFDE